jgi:polyhydroxyalkanoate synthesis repressor PhaR
MLACREMIEFAGMTTPKMTTPKPLVTIKQYADRRLYQPDAGSYVSLGDLAAMVEDDKDFVVYDAKTGTDITSLLLKQIILERAHHG